MQLLVPHQQIELTEKLQQCLSVAQQHGFATDSVMLGVSPTSCFQLQSDNTTTTITHDLGFGSDSDDHVDLQFHYNAQLTVDDYQASSTRSNQIFVGIEDSECVIDLWQYQGETRALRYDSSFNRDALEHFSWVVTLLALDFPIEDALTFSRAQLNVSRETWAHDYQVFPTPILDDARLNVRVGWAANAEQTQFPSMDKHQIGLYPVVDSVDWIEAVLKLGVKTTQLRIKDTRTPDLEAQVKRAIELGHEYDAQVFINDYWQLAIKHGAYGVHLGQEDIEESNLSQLAQAGICLGLSTHGYYELLRIVQINPSYIALGHIFPTTTKQMPSKPQGLIRLAHYQSLIDSIPYTSENDLGYPTVAIGGIDLTNAKQVWQCGVSSLAVVRAITLADDPLAVKVQFDAVMSDRSRVVLESNHA
ncbi:thiamine phosphate synthase [Vibrio astriarenae]|uniref:thiamine phosphate synthase n=1 Tax=Vibrio astriarenae TaxID=1481923 RepID=UPI0037364DD8